MDNSLILTSYLNSPQASPNENGDGLFPSLLQPVPPCLPYLGNDSITYQTTPKTETSKAPLTLQIFSPSTANPPANPINSPSRINCRSAFFSKLNCHHTQPNQHLLSHGPTWHMICFLVGLTSHTPSHHPLLL